MMMALEMKTSRQRLSQLKNEIADLLLIKPA
jgi:hypothetical protein